MQSMQVSSRLYLKLGASVNRECAMGVNRRGELATVDFDAVRMNPMSDASSEGTEKPRDSRRASAFPI